MERLNDSKRPIDLADSNGPADLSHLTVAERIEMVRMLTARAWDFEPGKEPKMRRDVVRTICGKR